MFVKTNKQEQYFGVISRQTNTLISKNVVILAYIQWWFKNFHQKIQDRIISFEDVISPHFTKPIKVTWPGFK